MQGSIFTDYRIAMLIRHFQRDPHIGLLDRAIPQLQVDAENEFTIGRQTFNSEMLLFGLRQINLTEIHNIAFD